MADINIVLCENCKWFGIQPEFDGVASWGDGCRWFSEESPNYDDFCSYGEPKEWKEIEDGLGESK